MQTSLFEAPTTAHQADFFNDHEQPIVAANPTEGGVRLTFRDAMSESNLRMMKRHLRGNVFSTGEIVIVSSTELFVKWYDKKTQDTKIAHRLLNLPADLKRCAESYLAMRFSNTQSSLF